MSNACLVCGHRNSPGDLLCQKCGAPLPEVSSPANAAPSSALPTRTRRRWVPVAIAALVVVLVLGGIYWWMQQTSGGGALLKRMPKQLDGVYVMDIQRLLKSDRVKKALDLPTIRQGLEAAKQQSGIDLLNMRAIVGGSRVVDGKLHLLVVAQGVFDVGKLNTMVRLVGSGEETIAGHKLQRFDIPPLQGFGADAFGGGPETESGEEEDNGTATIGEVAPPPSMITVPPIYMGAVDESLAVMGTVELLEEFFAGTDTLADDERMLDLMEEADDRGFAWGGGFITPKTVISLGAGHPLAALASANIPDEGLSFVMSMKLTDVFGLDASVTLPDAALAESVAEKLAMDPSDAPFPYALLLSSAQYNVAADGNKVSVSLRMKITDLPTL